MDAKNCTPLPWTTVRDNHISVNGESMRIVFSEAGWDVAYVVPVDGDEGNYNAKLIVRAVNAFADLLAVCEALPLDCEFEDAADYKDNAARFDRAMRLARAAIAKAKGGAA